MSVHGVLFNRNGRDQTANGILFEEYNVCSGSRARLECIRSRQFRVAIAVVTSPFAPVPYTLAHTGSKRMVRTCMRLQILCNEACKKLQRERLLG